jgi:hypothetical protein
VDTMNLSMNEALTTKSPSGTSDRTVRRLQGSLKGGPVIGDR